MLTKYERFVNMNVWPDRTGLKSNMYEDQHYQTN